MSKVRKSLLLFAFSWCLILSACGADETKEANETNETMELSQQAAGAQMPEVMEIAELPEYTGSPYAAVNGNQPEFTESDFTEESFETYSELDELGRCRTAYANIGKDLMPTEKRGAIGKVKPSGWHTVKYDTVDGKYLYNRCHLIGFQLTAENANAKNLITGTRYLNTEGMLPFENMVADYVRETENHVLYRVRPFYTDDNLVADGVQIEAMSVEDKGEGILFNVYCYNVQPGISIDYSTGESWIETENIPEKAGTKESTYILNTNTYKFHKPDCSSVKQMETVNTKEYTGNREEVEKQGYEACKRCKP